MESLFFLLQSTYFRLFAMQSFLRSSNSDFVCLFLHNEAILQFPKEHDFHVLFAQCSLCYHWSFFMLYQHIFASCWFAFCMFVSIVLLVWLTCLTCYIFLLLFLLVSFQHVCLFVFFFYSRCNILLFNVFFAFIRLQYISTDYCDTSFQYMCCVSLHSRQDVRVCFALFSFR